MSYSELNIAVIYGSYRSNRKGIRAASLAVSRLSGRCNATLLDAKAFDLPMLDKMYKEYKAGEAPEPMERLAGILKSSDGFVMVTAEYNHGLPAGLKNLLDHFQTEYLFKPVGILSYSEGSFGGVRAAVHLRAVLGELGMASISSMMPVPKVSNAIAEDGTAVEENTNKRFDRFAEELLWYADALKKARAQGTPF